jgi:signal transduction histidine kinase
MFRLLVLLFIAFLSPYATFCQPSRFDSLTNLLETSAPDTTKVLWMLELGELDLERATQKVKEVAYEAHHLAESIHFYKGMAGAKKILGDVSVKNGHITTGFKYYDRAIVFYKKSNDRKGQVSVLEAKGAAAYFSDNYAVAIPAFQEVVAYYRSAKDTLSLINALIRLSVSLEEKGEYESSIKISNESYELSMATNNLKDATRSLNNTGFVYRAWGKYVDALSVFQQALTLARKVDFRFAEGTLLQNIGIVHSRAGNSVEALQSYISALEIFEKLDDDQRISEMKFNIGLIYKKNGDYDRALVNYRESMAYDLKVKDSSALQYDYHNIGHIYLNIHQLDSAKYYLIKSYNLHKRLDLDCFDGEAAALGLLYMSHDLLDSAKHFFLEELASIDACGRKLNLPSVYLNLGKIHERKGEVKKSVNFYKNSLNVSQEINDMETIGQASKELYEYYKRFKDTENALKYFEISQQVVDSLFNQENTRKMAWLEANFQMDQLADSLTQIKESEARIFNEQIAEEERKQLMIIIISVSLLIVLLAVYLYLRKRRALKHQLILSALKNEGFKAVIAATEEERKRIAKDLHDGVVQQMAAVKLTLANVVSKLPPDQAIEVIKAKEIAEAAAEETRNLSHQMMPKVLIDVGLVAAMTEVIENTLFTNQVSVDFQQHGLRARYENQVEIAVYRIFQELVNNVVKHSQAKNVDVQLMENGGKLLLIVEDDGLGMASKKQSGIGLNNIQSRLTTIDGKVDYASGETSGTVATIVIPL